MKLRGKGEKGNGLGTEYRPAVRGGLTFPSFGGLVLPQT